MKKICPYFFIFMMLTENLSFSMDFKNKNRHDEDNSSCPLDFGKLSPLRARLFVEESFGKKVSKKISWKNLVIALNNYKKQKKSCPPEELRSLLKTQIQEQWAKQIEEAK